MKGHHCDNTYTSDQEKGCAEPCPEFPPSPQHKSISSIEKKSYSEQSWLPAQKPTRPGSYLQDSKAFGRFQGNF